MTYVSSLFLLFFLALFLVYYLLPSNTLRSLLLLAGNVFFCVRAGGMGTLVIMVGMTVVTYANSLLMGRTYSQFDREKEGLSTKERYALLASYKKKTIVYLIIGICLTLSVLLYVKIGRMAGLKVVSHLGSFVKNGRLLWRVYVPLGISYYTLSLIGYQLDVYWRKAVPEANFLRLLTCTTFFPIVVEGPISRFDELCGQFKRLPSFSYEEVRGGMQLMLWGFFKKLVVADRFAIMQDQIFGNIRSYRGFEVVLAVLANIIVDYADFSGCIDIARGAAQVLGIHLAENFKQPFFSKSASEFWRRWHMTLGTWFKDYLYMPIARSGWFIKQVGMVRKKRGKRFGQVFATGVPLMLVWFMTGFWHGTGWDYIMWGLYWGTVILLSMILEPHFRTLVEWLHFRTDTFGWQLFQMIRTFILFGIGRMITATGSVHGFFVTVRQMFASFNPWVFFDGTLFSYGLDASDVVVGLVGIAVIYVVDLLQSKFDVRESLEKQPVVFRWLLLYGCFVFILVFGIYGLGYKASSFMYGQF